MKNTQLPKTTRYGLNLLWVICFIPLLLFMLTVASLYSQDTLTPQHFFISVTYLVNLMMVSVFVASMKKAKRWSYLITICFLSLNIFAEFYRLQDVYLHSFYSFLFVVLFWLPVQTSSLILLISPSSRQFFSKKKRSKDVVVFVRNIASLKKV